MTLTQTPFFHGPFIEPRLSWELIRRRDAFLAQADFTKNPIPDQFPSTVSSPSVFASGQLQLDSVTQELQAADIDELESALENFQTQYNDLNMISRTTFPLPNLGPRLRQIALEIHSGRGVFILRGLCPAKYSFRENIILYAGIADYIGDMRGKQSGDKDLITHVRPSSLVTDPRTILTTEDLPFHNDVGEILSLYIYEPATHGGNTLISSSGHVYNEIARTKPHLISVLAERNWPHWTARKPHRQMDFAVLYAGEDVPGAQKIPYFDFARYTLTGSTASPRPHDVMPLTALQADAMDTLELIAAKNAVSLPQRKGDIHFINNRAYLHARTAIPDLDRARHLMRLILRDSELGYDPTEDEEERCGHPFEFPPEEGKWAVENNNINQLLSSSNFDSLYFDATSHSDS
ncbi:Clavaminate synthase-like protein [Plenodomus tracheiphilus IPT5]|uniref:Clavaminate synthase-like protein n=1 Tax=Plenodomus tracheiphilus IPT5 TaxID=1408161 RepID=A0A6A7B4I7_9PLEO|nr:Clavaminate synthase-like protein [Plenodomus tracheiphilus IPT5]